MRLIAEADKKGVDRKLEIKFLASPKEIKGSGKVSEVIFTINEMKDGKILATNKTFSIKTG
jgi:ferredoxin--NADP+ reductase